MKLETITPKRASEMLTMNTSNRPLRTKRVTRLAGVITDGKWKVNGDAIRFNGSVLVDGQHRLAACVESGLPIKTWVLRGLDESAFDTIDQGVLRTVGDMFARTGEKHYSDLSVAVRWLWCIHNNCVQWVVGGSNQWRADLAREYLEQHPQLRESLDTIHELTPRPLWGRGMAAAFHRAMAEKATSVEADAYWGDLFVGERLTKRNPAYLVRERLIAIRAAQAKPSRVVVAAFVVKGWNAVRANKPLGVLKWAPDEQFPKIR